MSPKSLIVLLLAVVVLTTPSLADFLEQSIHEHKAPTPATKPPEGKKPPTHGHHPAHSPAAHPPVEPQTHGHHHGHHAAHSPVANPPLEHGGYSHKPPRKVLPPAPTPSEKSHGHHSI
ncbi:hypothetical protein LOK49_LG06G02679 [Camellia lanceoleosa]|uniref:Uncharacterized protein n=1 Tax=Camellia lanceoleosa TaxID=1840588 RepID=A0ACC0HE39_9ERIC|nr:hypothetical protein LOK49_LG06G02679 [Camellia lanceoleosa]